VRLAGLRPGHRSVSKVKPIHPRVIDALRGSADLRRMVKALEDLGFRQGRVLNQPLIKRHCRETHLRTIPDHRGRHATALFWAKPGFSTKIAIGVGAQSTLGGKARHSYPKIMYEKLTKARILRDIWPKNIFPIFFFGGEHVAPITPSLLHL